MSKLAYEDTIAAIATALGEASVGIVRISGSQVRDVVGRTFRSPSGKPVELPDGRGMLYGFVVDPLRHERIDECILLWMPGPRSYTAEDVAEYQVHGGVRVLQSVLDSVLRAGARLAEPGEFTKRAFLNGRIDLSQAEAVIDLIRAKTDMASRSALNQVRGRLSEKIQALRKQLVALQAHVEVTIDYPEHDVESDVCQMVVETGQEILNALDEMIQNAQVGQILREGVVTTIAGRPNVGKSSLMNALLRRDRAIVTDIPGTTRDVLEEYVNIRGIPFRLVDTAGIRETSDVVERIGVEKSREMVQTAELILLVLNRSEPLTPEDVELIRDTEAVSRIVVLNKADLPGAVAEEELRRLVGDSPIVTISARDASGLGALEEWMEKMVLGSSTGMADLSYMTNARQAQLLREAKSDLERAIEAASMGATLDIIAVQLQAAYASLGLVIGEEVGEDLLDEIFSRFCLGK
jgi:tRNA modification GTPase